MKASTTKSTPAKQASTTSFFDSQKSEGQFFGENKVASDEFFPVQTKLSIGSPNDKYEQEADATADRVVKGLSDQKNSQATGNPPSPAPPGIQHKCAECEEKAGKEKPAIQRKPIFESDADGDAVQRKCASCGKEEQVQKKSDGSAEASPNIQSQLSNSKGGGSSLPDDTRSSMESSMGADFSNVRVHTDSNAVQMNKSLGAQAFTHGSDVYFNEGKYDTNSNAGNHLLAHELTHTVQQGKSTPQNNNGSKIQTKLEDYEKPEHSKNSEKRLDGKVKEEVSEEDIEEGKNNKGDYEKPDPKEKKAKSAELEKPAKPDINEAAIAKPKNEKLAQESEDKIEFPEEVVAEGEEKEVEPKKKKISEQSIIESSNIKSKKFLTNAQKIELPPKPTEVIVPEPFEPVDSVGEALPFDINGDKKVNETAKKTQELRDKGQILKVNAAESMSKADVMEGKLEVTKGAVAESQKNLNIIDESFKTRREYVVQSEEALGVVEEKQIKELEETPQYLDEAKKQKKESEPIAEESREKKAENDRNKPDDADDREKAEEQGSEIDKVVDAGDTIDKTFEESQLQAELLLEKNANAKLKNEETKIKTDQMHLLLDQGDTHVANMKKSNVKAKAQISARSGQPEEVRVQAREIELAGDGMILSSMEKESELHAAQKKYQEELTAIPKFDVEKQLEKESQKGDSSDALIQRSPEEGAQGDYAKNKDVFAGTFLDPNKNLTLQERQAMALRAQEKRALEVQRINDYYDKPFEEYTGWQKIKAGIGVKFNNFTDWLSKSLSFPNVIGGIGRMILDSFNPLTYLKGIGGGLMKVVNGGVNLVDAIAKGDFWRSIKGVADIATGVATIAGTITALSIVVAAVMTALLIFTWGFAWPVAGPVIGAMASIMGWAAPIAIWSGIASAGLNVFLGIKSLYDMATSESADELAAETDDLMEDVKNALTGGLMAVIGVAGKNLAPKLLSNAKALTLAGAIGGRGWLLKALLAESLLGMMNLLTVKSGRKWLATKLDDIVRWKNKKFPKKGKGGALGGKDKGSNNSKDKDGTTDKDQPNDSVREENLGDISRTQKVSGKHELKYTKDGRVYLCSEYCKDVTEFVNKYGDEIAKNDWIKKRFDEIGDLADDVDVTKSLNKLEREVRISKETLEKILSWEKEGRIKGDLESLKADLRSDNPGTRRGAEAEVMEFEVEINQGKGVNYNGKVKGPDLPSKEVKARTEPFISDKNAQGWFNSRLKHANGQWAKEGTSGSVVLNLGSFAKIGKVPINSDLAKSMVLKALSKGGRGTNITEVIVKDSSGKVLYRGLGN